MFDSILSTAKAQLQEQLKEKIGLNEHQVSQIVDIAGESIQEQAKAETMSGNTDGLLHLFGCPDAHTSTTNPIVENMGNSFVSKMISRLGLPDTLAELTKNLILPYLLQIISSKFSESGGKDAAKLLSLFQGAGKDGILENIKDRISQNKLGGLF